MDEVCIGDVDGFFGRGEADAVWPAEPIGHDADIACFGVVAVDLLRELWFGPEALLVAVNGVGKPDGAVRVDDDVIGGIEGAGVVVVEDGGGFVGTFGFHVDQARWFFQASLGAEDEAFTVVCAAIGHEIALRTTYFVARKVCRGEEFDFRDDDCFIMCGNGVGRGIRDVIGGNEEGVCWGVEDACFVEVGGTRIMDEELDFWGGTEKGEEGVVIDEKGFGLRVGGGGRGELAPF